ncbi:hypothetical protein [Vagococcus zengguangii]|uniref:Uncharacterized protein n=1 Tax=Vagococcus zengguangii TaxID=2571750 RepID=A0A4D7CU90_9ENTE|nr:hypothetical protein [Vagococcus zengguangii]QCI86784.1 hypothetical protein FA707_07330 [Vagococcus zengguangii]TLG80390.1 hypothetical protein FE258_04955 [Vagococcus zengguangii]
MGMMLGALGLVLGIVGVILTFQNKNSRWLSYASLSLTALAICAEYSAVVKWIEEEDLAALMDVTPTMSSMLWILTFATIGINGLSFWKNLKLKVE